MLKASRHDALLAQLRADGSLGAVEVAQHLGVSEDTIRRDLRELAAAGQLQRVHGGAIPRAAQPPSYVRRAQTGQLQKAAIGRRAAALARNGQLLFFDGGSTALSVAEQLSPELQATVITNAPAVASLLVTHPGVSIHLAGGAFNKELGVTVGTETTDFLRGFTADISYIGVCALDANAGLTVPSPDELATKRSMIARSARVVALADASKLGQAFPYVVAAADSVTDLVIDEEADQQTLAVYEGIGITVHQ